MTTQSDYYPSKIKLDVFPNKIYHLTWMQHGHPREALLNKSKAFAMVNDRNVDKALRQQLVEAFRAGVIV